MESKRKNLMLVGKSEFFVCTSSVAALSAPSTWPWAQLGPAPLLSHWPENTGSTAPRTLTIKTPSHPAKPERSKHTWRGDASEIRDPGSTLEDSWWIPVLPSALWVFFVSPWPWPTRRGDLPACSARSYSTELAGQTWSFGTCKK